MTATQPTKIQSISEAVGDTDLPEGWEPTTLPEVCQINPPKPSKDALPADSLVTFVPMPAVDAELGAITEPELRPFGKVRKGYTAFREGDVIFAKITPCMENGKAAIARGLHNGVGFGSTEFLVLRPTGALLEDFICYFIRQESYRKSAEAEMTGSVGQKRVPKGFLERTELHLPPLPEQKRIVAKVQALLAEVNKARERLAKVPTILKRFRQSVLAAACSGRLTEDWREKHPDIEPASELLASIAKRRRIAYGAALREAERKGDRKPRKIFPDKPSSIKAEMPGLPETWAVTNVDFLAHVTKLAGFEYTKYINLENVGEVPVVRAQNVQMGRFLSENLKYISKKVSDFLERSQLHGREILMVFIGAGTGNVCMAPKEDRWHLAPNVAKIDVDGVSTRYLLLYLQSPIGFSYMSSWIKATAQPSLSMATIREIVVHLPPLTEQHEIVRRVEALFALADTIENRVKGATTRAGKLTQSILSKAFRGELVPTEAELARKENRTYEPASALLKKIKSTRTAKAKETKKRKRTTRKPRNKSQQKDLPYTSQ
ncbi:restriction endonuclease subunit S [Acidobacteria bacterium AH-259-L09]|nr:restriction endonuclease subunit S [Acidobacteria bacterium AH-259-L09]